MPFDYHHHCSLAPLSATIKIQVDDLENFNYSKSFSWVADLNSVPSIYGLDIHLKPTQYPQDLYIPPPPDSLWPPTPAPSVQSARPLPAEDLQTQSDPNPVWSPELGTSTTLLEMMPPPPDYETSVSNIYGYRNQNFAGGTIEVARNTNSRQDYNPYRSGAPNTGVNVNSSPANAVNEHCYNPYCYIHQQQWLTTNPTENPVPFNQCWGSGNRGLLNYPRPILAANTVTFNQNGNSTRRTPRRYRRIAPNLNGHTTRLIIYRRYSAANGVGSRAAASTTINLDTPVTNIEDDVILIVNDETNGAEDSGNPQPGDSGKPKPVTTKGILKPLNGNKHKATKTTTRSNSTVINGNCNNTPTGIAENQNTNTHNTRATQEGEIYPSHVVSPNPSASNGNANASVVQTATANQSQPRRLWRIPRLKTRQKIDYWKHLPTNSDSAAVSITYMSETEFRNSWQQLPLSLRVNRQSTQHVQRPAAERQRPPQKCNFCSSIFTKVKPIRFTCQLCRRGFYNRSQVIRHMRVHTGEKPFQCDYCGVRYRDKYSLNTHIRTVHFICVICRAAFPGVQYLNKHKRMVHTASKPFECGKCHRCYKTLTTLKHHMLLHEPKVFKCPACERNLNNVGCGSRIRGIHTLNTRIRK